jgi:hypothetical protein
VYIAQHMSIQIWSQNNLIGLTESDSATLDPQERSSQCILPNKYTNLEPK